MADRWACPFCGRYSAEEPATKLQPLTHHLETVGAAKAGKDAIWAVFCWYCGARGPLSGSIAEALARWGHRADSRGAPRW